MWFRVYELESLTEDVLVHTWKGTRLNDKPTSSALSPAGSVDLRHHGQSKSTITTLINHGFQNKLFMLRQLLDIGIAQFITNLT